MRYINFNPVGIVLNCRKVHKAITLQMLFGWCPLRICWRVYLIQLKLSYGLRHLPCHTNYPELTIVFQSYSSVNYIYGRNRIVNFHPTKEMYHLETLALHSEHVDVQQCLWKMYLRVLGFYLAVGSTYAPPKIYVSSWVCKNKALCS